MKTKFPKNFWHRWRYGLWFFIAVALPFGLAWECIRRLDRYTDVSAGAVWWAWAGIAVAFGFLIFVAPLLAYRQAHSVLSQEQDAQKGLKHETSASFEES